MLNNLTGHCPFYRSDYSLPAAAYCQVLPSVVDDRARGG